MTKKNVGRPGITKLQIKEAVKALLQAGELDPGSRAIRHALNDTGSFEAINKYLKALRTECLRTVLLEDTQTEARLPEPLQQALVEIWERLQAASQAETLQVRELAAESMAQAEEARTQAVDKAHALEETLGKERLQANHLQTDLKLKTAEWKSEREQRLQLEARLQEVEKHLQQVQEAAQSRLAELEQAHQATLKQLEHQFKAREQHYQKDNDYYKSALEEQRQKYMAELDHYKTAKTKAEKAQLKAETALKEQIGRYQELLERAKTAEFDLTLARQHQQASEKTLITRQTEITLKDTLMAEYKQKIEAMAEQIGQLKAQKAKTKKR